MRISKNIGNNVKALQVSAFFGTLKCDDRQENTRKNFVENCKERA